MSWLKKFRRLVSLSKLTSEPPDLSKLQEILDYRFLQPELLELALTHRSLVRARSGLVPSNERLEFLGDSVLGLVIADQLFQDHPRLAEGDLTKRKAMLVNEAALARVAMEIGLNRYIRLSGDEEKSGGRDRPSIVSDAFEAVMGAVYLDGGLEAVRSMILKHLYSRRQVIINDISQQNFKGDLLELVQSDGNRLPQYNVIEESGPDHDKIFRVVVSVDKRPIGEGTGPSKKDAEQKAARMALQRLNQSSA